MSNHGINTGEPKQFDLIKELLNFKHALINKPDKVSAEDNAYKIGVKLLPKIIRNILLQKNISNYWIFEGSVGRGTWSRTPWIAVYDERVTSRASDGFYIAFIVAENKESLFLMLMNSSSKHYNYTPYRLIESQIEKISDFNLGKIPKAELSCSGRGSGVDFEDSTLLWKKYSIDEFNLQNIEKDFLSISNYYFNLVNSLEKILPIDKPFKFNPFSSK